MATWLEDIVTALTNLGGKARYRELYPEIRRIRSAAYPLRGDETIRRTIEEHSSDSEYFAGRGDIFYSVDGIGKGHWGLRALLGQAGTIWDLTPGDPIRRVELHDRFGGSRQGGIAPSNKSPNVLIFTDPEAGAKHGYIYDGWDVADPSLFHYTGEGQVGDQVMAGGNKAILDHLAKGRSLRVFKGVRGVVRYMGEFRLDSTTHAVRRAPATGGGPQRDVIVFRLRPVGAAVSTTPRPTPGSYKRAKPSKAKAGIPFDRDPNAVDRALQAHADIQNALNDFLVAAGARPWSPRISEPDFDIAWTWRRLAFVCEVKSLTVANEERQIRLGLGQVLDYQELMTTQRPGVRAVLAIERKPRDDRWMRLCERHGVILVWPGTFDVLVDAALSAPTA